MTAAAPYLWLSALLLAISFTEEWCFQTREHLHLFLPVGWKCSGNTGAGSRNGCGGRGTSGFLLTQSEQQQHRLWRRQQQQQQPTGSDVEEEEGGRDSAVQCVVGWRWKEEKEHKVW